jgi:hypothetical protein
LARNCRAISTTSAAIGVVVLLIISAAGYAFLALRASTSTAVSTGPLPSASSFEIANITVARVPYYGPEGIAANANTGRIYVTDGTNNVTIVDSSNYSVVGKITLPGSPRSGITVDSQRNMVYVSTWGCTNKLNVTNSCQAYKSWPSGGIVEINGASDKIVGNIPIGVDRLAVNPITNILYGVVGQNLLSIDGNSRSLVANTSLGVDIGDIAVNAKTNMVYAIACKIASLGCIGGELIGLDGLSNKERFSVPLNYNFIQGLVVDSTANTVYTVAVQRNMTLLSINGGSGAIQYSSNIAACGVGAGGTTLAFDSATNRLYITASGYLLEINAANGGAVNMISASGATRVAASPDGTHVYLLLEHQTEQFGYLLVLPNATGNNYVNSSMLKSSGGCMP